MRNCFLLRLLAVMMVISMMPYQALSVYAAPAEPGTTVEETAGQTATQSDSVEYSGENTGQMDSVQQEEQSDNEKNNADGSSSAKKKSAEYQKYY